MTHNMEIVGLNAVWHDENDIVIVEIGYMIEFRDIPKFSWAGSQTNTHDIVLSHKITAMCVFDITFKCIIVPWFFCQNTVYCISVVRLAGLLSQPAKLGDFAKLKYFL